MEKRKEKADQNAVAELTREWLYKENKWLWEENRKLKKELEWYKTEHERLVDKLVIKWATELLDMKFEIKKWWQWE